MEVPEKNLLAFRDSVCEVLSELNPDFAPGNRIFFADSYIAAGEVNDDTFEALQGLAPFGSGHTEPIFWLNKVKVLEQKLLSSDKHLKFLLQHDRFKYKKLSGLLWHKAADYKDNYVDQYIDILFTFGKETRGFGSKFYLQIVDLKFSE